MKTSGIVTHFYTDIEEQLESTSGITFNHSTNSISTGIVAKDFDAIVDFKYKLNDEGYFHIGDNFDAIKYKLSGSNSTTEAYGYSGSLTVTVTDKAMAEGAEEFAKELAEKEERQAKEAEEAKKKEKADKDKKSSNSESSQTSKSTV